MPTTSTQKHENVTVHHKVKDYPAWQLAMKFRELANRIWLAGLGSFGMAQEEGTKMFESLVAEGERVVQERTDERITEVRERAMGAWDKLGKVFDERVGRALHSVNVPTRKDVDTLTRRVAELTHITKQLAERRRAA